VRPCEAPERESTFPGGFLVRLSAMNSEPVEKLARVKEVADLLLYLESAPFVNGEIAHVDVRAHAGKW
jgi:hypothetical protein